MFRRKIRRILEKLFLLKKNGAEVIPRFTPLEKKFLGERLFIHDIASFNLCYHELFLLEMYKFKAESSKPYIIDCGANMGMSIIYFKKLYPEATIIAFEADDYIFTFLEKNINSYELKNVELINKAVWSNDDILSFRIEGGAGGRVEKETSNGKYKKVSSVRLKNYLVNQRVDFLKLDIEGAEYEVIKDCEGELNNIDFLFIEYHSLIETDQNLHEILEIVQRAGFRYHLKEAYSSQFPFISREINYGMDLQLNIFCYRT